MGGEDLAKGRGGGGDAWLGLPVVAGIFLALSLAFLWRALDEDLILRDAYHEFLPLVEMKAWWRRGAAPLWNPFTQLGVPLAGAVFPANWYPPAILLFGLFPLPSGPAMGLYLVFHFALAGTAMFYLSRRTGARPAAALAGAMAYAFGGYLASMHYALNMLPSFGLLPLAGGLMVRPCEPLPGRGAADDSDDDTTRGGWRLASMTRPVMAGVCAGAILLGGDPQGFGLAILFASAMAPLFPGEGRGDKRGGGRATAGALAAAAVFIATAVLSSAAELLPMFGVLAESGREGGLAYDIATCWSTHPVRAAEFFLARPFGTPWPHDGWWGAFMGERCFPWPMAMSLYMGGGALVGAVAAVLGIRRGAGRALVFALCVTALFFLLAMGGHSPLYRALYEWAPLFSAFRYPEKYLLMCSLGIAMLAAHGWDTVMIERPPPADGRPAAVLGPGAIGAHPTLGALAAPSAVLALVVCLWLAPRLFPGFFEGLVGPLLRAGAPLRVGAADAIHDASSAVARTGIFAALALSAMAALKRARSRALLLAPAALLCLDLFLANRVLVPTAPGLGKHGSPLAQIIAERSGHGGGPGSPLERLGVRIFRDPYIPAPGGLTYGEIREWERETLKPNLAALDGIEYFSGLNVAGSGRFRDMASRTLTIADMPVFGAGYAAVAEERLGALSDIAAEVARRRGAALAEFADPMPRAYWIGDAVYAGSVEEAEGLFAITDHRRRVVVELPREKMLSFPPAPPLSAGGGGLVPAEVERRGPNETALRVDAPARGWLVLNEAYYAGWRATVGGEAAEVFRANCLVRAVEAGPGPAEVVFAYRPPGLFAGLSFTVVSWILAAALFILAWKPGRAAGPPGS